MADLKIYNNGENKVLMSAGSRIIRQPYEFGNAHNITNNTLLYNYYIQCLSPVSNINIEDFSVILFSKPPFTTSNNRGIFAFKSNSYECALGIGARSYFDGIQVDFNKSTELTSGEDTTKLIAGTGINRSIVDAVSFSRNTIKAYRSTPTLGVKEYTFNSSVIPFTPDTYNYLKIARGQRGQHSYETPYSSFYINRFLVFNRIISKQEVDFVFSSGNGSNPQSVIGLSLDIITNKAEILDFSALQDGSDLRVGCRDYSGFNRHGQIMNLPVGSLEDQLAFANANLFVPFIQ